VTSYATYGGSASQVVDYYYDAENRWIAETIDSDGDGQIDRTLGFVYDGDQVVLQFEGTRGEGLGASDLSHRYLWQANAVDQLLADEQLLSATGSASGGEGGSDGYDLTAPGDVLFAFTDHLGTVRDLATYDNGITSIANHRVYDSFGNVTSQSNAAVDCLFGFTGRAYDENSGLQNNLNRWYDSKVGRWVSEDPIGFLGQDANTSRYCGNNSVIYVDPSGQNRWVLHNGIGWLGHWWIIVEVWDPTGQRVVGYQKLEWDPIQGYSVPEPGVADHFSELVVGVKRNPNSHPAWGKPGSGGLGDGVIAGEWKSNAAQDRALLEQWGRWDRQANSHSLFVATIIGEGRFFSYCIGWNCMSAALWYADYGGDAGPAVLIVK